MAGKRGRDISGWLIVDKPAGIGSTDVVGLVRRALGARKAGHAGTLDPDATGVLAVALGEATKTVPYVTDGTKTYRFTVRFGAATATDDAEGEVIARSDLRPSDDAIRDALPRFTGDILQVPPRVSAVKVAGERAYDLAREGAEFDLAARPLHVARLALLARPDADTAEFEMVCGKGGYVRSVARDLGEALGCLGHVVTLRRLSTGPFGLQDAVEVETIRAEAGMPSLDARLFPLERGLGGLPELGCDAGAAARLRHGNPAPVLTGTDDGAEAWASLKGRAVAIGTYSAGFLHPSRVFAE